jgi:hypothetical protein
MSNLLRLVQIAVLSIASAAGLSACVIAPAQPRVVYRDAPAPSQPQGSQQYPQEVVVDSAPPPIQYEVIPVIPFPGALWIAGHWGWFGGRHAWIGGHYSRPVHGHRYVPRRWEHRGHGRWALRGGFWVR